MIFDQDIHPEKDLYYLGGKVIGFLDNSNQTEFDYFELYSALKENLPVNFYFLISIKCAKSITTNRDESIITIRGKSITACNIYILFGLAGNSQC